MTVLKNESCMKVLFKKTHEDGEKIVMRGGAF